jgi:pyrimidine operon attenuation protein/uracil phosphoribosyltransferase
MSRLAMDAAEVEQCVARIVDRLLLLDQLQPAAIVGIRRGGEALAKRIATRLGDRTGVVPPVGTVDITLYRDDGFGPRDWPTVGVTRIDFVLKEHTVVLVDDVLFTGRTVRAAMDAILDYGRPRAVRLAVLIDRGFRELPIQADAVGRVIATERHERVEVRFAEDGHEGTDVQVLP